MEQSEFNAIRNLLIEEGVLKKDYLIGKTKPSHGPCCSCQECGHFHDECVCEHNRILKALSQLCEIQLYPNTGGKWTRIKPTRPGWYWLATDENSAERRIEKFKLEDLEAFNDYYLWGWEWAGPILLPERPEGE